MPGRWYPLGVKDKSSVYGVGVFDATLEWLKRIGMFQSFTQDSLFWCSVLAARDLPAAEPEHFGLEAYNPKLVAKQFGLCQSLAIPLLTTGNHHWESRFVFSEEDVWGSPTLQYNLTRLPFRMACNLITESYQL